VSLEELTGVLVGLEQRINAYRNRFHELEKQRRLVDDEIATIKKYLKLAEILHRVEVDKGKISALSTELVADEKLACALTVDVTDQSREILLGRSQYAGKSVPEAAYQVLREANRAMHAKELVQRLVEGGLHIKGKTPLTSVATSLKRDKRFRKVGPNTFEAPEEVLSHAV
jgi:HB1, ASXL, restriction endonuclease HTH domain